MSASTRACLQRIDALSVSAAKRAAARAEFERAEAFVDTVAGMIEAAVAAVSCRMATFVPGCSLSTPSVTTVSPAASPVVMAVIFFGVFTPFGLVMRAFGRDAMKRRFEPTLPSYWERRDPPGPADNSFRDMF